MSVNDTHTYMAREVLRSGDDAAMLGHCWVARLIVQAAAPKHAGAQGHFDCKASGVSD